MRHTPHNPLRDQLRHADLYVIQVSILLNSGAFLLAAIVDFHIHQNSILLGIPPLTQYFLPVIRAIHRVSRHHSPLELEATLLHNGIQTVADALQLLQVVISRQAVIHICPVANEPGSIRAYFLMQLGCLPDSSYGDTSSWFVSIVDRCCNVDDWLVVSLPISPHHPP